MEKGFGVQWKVPYAEGFMTTSKEIFGIVEWIGLKKCGYIL